LSPEAATGSISPSSPVYKVEVELEPKQLQGIEPETLRRGYSVAGKVIVGSARITALLWKAVLGEGEN